MLHTKIAKSALLALSVVAASLAGCDTSDDTEGSVNDRSGSKTCYHGYYGATVIVNQLLGMRSMKRATKRAAAAVSPISEGGVTVGVRGEF